MPETRSQTKLGQLRGGRPSVGRGRGRGRGRFAHASKTSTGSDTSVHKHSELGDSTQNLTPGSSRRATQGFNLELYVDRLQRHESTRGAYYAFQLKTPVSVRIYNPDIGEGKVECTCEDHQHHRSACIHINVSSVHQLRILNLVANRSSGSLMVSTLC